MPRRSRHLYHVTHRATPLGSMKALGRGGAPVSRQLPALFSCFFWQRRCWQRHEELFPRIGFGSCSRQEPSRQKFSTAVCRKLPSSAAPCLPLMVSSSRCKPLYRGWCQVSPAPSQRDTFQSTSMSGLRCSSLLQLIPSVQVRFPLGPLSKKGAGHLLAPPCTRHSPNVTSMGTKKNPVLNCLHSLSTSSTRGSEVFPNRLAFGEPARF